MSCGEAPLSSAPAAVSAFDSLNAIHTRGTGTSVVVINDEPCASRSAPVSPSGDVATEDADHAGSAASGMHSRPSAGGDPEQPRPTARTVPADGVDDREAVNLFLRNDPAARRWLRGAVELDARAPLPAQPADSGYFAQMVEVIREDPTGLAMLRAVSERAEATTVPDAAPRFDSSASTPEAPRWGSRATCGRLSTHAWTSGEEWWGVVEANPASASGLCGCARGRAACAAAGDRAAACSVGSGALLSATHSLRLWP